MSHRNPTGWRDFWKNNLKASCLPDKAETESEIVAQWQTGLGAADDGCRILDIATGNGIVLAWAAAAGREHGRHYALTGVDLADIDPPRYLRDPDPDLARARFHGNTAAEALPFAAAEFDLVTSQYGLEYAELDAALTEVERVLAPGGRFVWLAHCPASEIIRQHRNEAGEVDLLLGEDGPLAAMASVVAGLAARRDITECTTAGNDALAPALTSLAESFRQAQDYARAHPPARLIGEICGTLAQIAGRLDRYRPDELAAMLAAARERLKAHRARIGSLLDAVLTTERLEFVRSRLASPPWESSAIDEVRVGEGESPIGLHITAVRATTPAAN